MKATSTDPNDPVIEDPDAAETLLDATRPLDRSRPFHGRFVVSDPMHPLGKGAQATVYCAADLVMGGYVALKVLHLDVADDPDVRARFERECAVHLCLDSPYIARCLDWGGGDDHEPLWMAQELVDGRELKKLLSARRRFCTADACAIVEQLASALDVVHKAGVVHRDVKPANILVSRRGDTWQVTLVDFGVAKTTHEDGVAQLTLVGAVLGSLAFMSPEQILGAAVDHHADVWALGVVGYRLLTGLLPFPGKDLQSASRLIVDGAAPLVSEVVPELGTLFDSTFTRAFQKDIRARYPTATAFARDFKLACNYVPPPEPDRTVVLAPATPHVAVPPALLPVCAAVRAASFVGASSLPGVETRLRSAGPAPVLALVLTSSLLVSVLAVLVLAVPRRPALFPLITRDDAGEGEVKGAEGGSIGAEDAAGLVEPDAGPGDAEPGNAEPRDAEPGNAEPRDAEPGNAEPRDAAPRDVHVRADGGVVVPPGPPPPVVVVPSPVRRARIDVEGVCAAGRLYSVVAEDQARAHAELGCTIFNARKMTFCCSR